MKTKQSSTITMADVAVRAGVTKATVSHVITGKVAVRNQTRKRVLDAIAELGYRPNLVARGLTQGKTFLLGLLLPILANPFYPEIAEEIEKVAAQHQYQLMFCVTHGDKERGHTSFEMLSHRAIDGLLVMENLLGSDDMLALIQRGIPTVLCNWEGDQTIFAHAFPLVNFDFLSAGEIAARHFVELGHHAIAIILEHPTHVLRLEGFRRGLHAAHLELSDSFVQHTSMTFEGGYRAAEILLTRTPRPTAIFATNDLMALGAIRAAFDLHVRVPEDVSIMGMDDILPAQWGYPQLTTVATPRRELAIEAMELLLRRVSDPAPRPPVVTLLRPQLVIRESTMRAQ